MATAYLFSPEFSSDVDRSRVIRRGAEHPSREHADLDEASLLERLRRGDELAFEAIFRAYTPAMYRTATALLGASDPASDVVQGVMYRLWLQREHVVVRGALGAYLRVATVNAARNVIRGTTRGRAWVERAAVSLTPTLHESGDEDTLIDRRIATLEHAIAALPERTREIFLLWWNGELSYRDIAQATGISVKGVERARARALDALRHALIDAGLGPAADV